MLTNQPAWHGKFSIFLRLGDTVHCGVKLLSIYIYILILSPISVGFSIVYISKRGTLSALKKKNDVELALNQTPEWAFKYPVKTMDL